MAMRAIPAARPLTSVSTRPEREAERFGFFCDAICDVYLGIRPHRLSERPFDAEFAAYDLGGPVLARMSAPGHAAPHRRLPGSGALPQPRGARPGAHRPS